MNLVQYVHVCSKAVLHVRRSGRPRPIMSSICKSRNLPHSTSGTMMMTPSSATVLLAMAIATLPFTHGLSNIVPRYNQQQSTRRVALLTLPSLAAADESGSSKMKFQRYPQLRFIAALGDP